MQRELLDPCDITGLPFALAVRCTATLDLSGALNEAKAWAEASGTTAYAAIHRRKGYPVDSAYVTLPLCLFADVLRRYGA